jgi:hypothetical protein
MQADVLEIHRLLKTGQLSWDEVRKVSALPEGEHKPSPELRRAVVLFRTAARVNDLKALRSLAMSLLKSQEYAQKQPPRSAKPFEASSPGARPVPSGRIPEVLYAGKHDIDRKKLASTLGFLTQVPTGPEDLKTLEEGRVAVDFDYMEGGALYQASTRSIRLSRTLTPARTVVDLAHEIQHARDHLRGLAGNAFQDSRNDFIALRLEEEARAYWREAELGRELIHLARAKGEGHWREVATNSSVQIYFQLGYGCPYDSRPTEDALSRDAAQSSTGLEQLKEFMRPYFQRFVRAYTRPEGVKWDLVHGRISHVDSPMLMRFLTREFSHQDPEWTRPLRPFSRRA